MVQVDISQLSGECNTWREQLRSYRDDLNKSKQSLQQIAGQQLSKDQLQEVEHYHNQFHIQLINIHDLKQLIKAHDRRVNYEVAANQGQISDDSVHDHEKLFEEYTSLEHTLQDLKEEYNRFLDRAR